MFIFSSTLSSSFYSMKLLFQCYKTLKLLLDLLRTIMNLKLNTETKTNASIIHLLGVKMDFSLQCQKNQTAFGLMLEI